MKGKLLNFLLSDFRENEEGRKRETHLFVVPFTYALIGWLLYVP